VRVNIHISSYETSVISAAKHKRRFRLGRTRASYRTLAAIMTAESRVRNIRREFKETKRESMSKIYRDHPAVRECSRE